jgi:hypothetical protein
MSLLVFWVVIPCGLVGGYQRFGGTYCYHLQFWTHWEDYYLGELERIVVEVVRITVPSRHSLVETEKILRMACAPAENRTGKLPPEFKSDLSPLGLPYSSSVFRYFPGTYLWELKLINTTLSPFHHQWRYSPDRALASLKVFMIVIVRCGLSAPRSTCSRHPDSVIRDI